MKEAQGVVSPNVRQYGAQVILNVYDLNQNWLELNGLLRDTFQLGAFHVGVEVFGKEWSFGTDGVNAGRPRQHSVHVYRQSIPLGRARCNRDHLISMIRNMAVNWVGETYDILSRNCCTFARELCCNILGQDNIPSWIDRLASGLAGVLGPVGMMGLVAMSVDLQSSRSLADIRQESQDNEVSALISSQYESNPTKQPYPFRAKQFLSQGNQSFPQGSCQIGAASPYSSHRDVYPTTSAVCRPGPAAISPGVRRFVSAVY